MSKWIGYAVSVNCGEPLGCYQGTILEADGTTITLTKAFRNGFPYPKSQVTLKATDIKDLRIIESRASPSAHAHSTVAVGKNKKCPRSTVCENLQANPSSSGNQQALSNAICKPGSARGPAPAPARSKPIDIQASRNKNTGHTGGSYPHPGSTPKAQGPGTDKARRRNEACFGDAAEPALDRDFDFEGNLALFDKQALWQQMNNSHKPDLVRQTEDTIKFRHDENVLGGTRGGGGGGGVTVLPAWGALACAYVTDEGLRVPGAAPALRAALWAALRRHRLAAQATLLLARAAADLALRLLGGGRRLDPNNAHQTPTVVVVCGWHAVGAAGLAAARLLQAHGVAVQVVVPSRDAGEAGERGEALRDELAALALCGVRVLPHTRSLPRPDLVLLATHHVEAREDQHIYTEQLQWAGGTRAVVVVVEPPDGEDPAWAPVGARACLSGLLPGAPAAALGRLWLANLAPPPRLLADLDVAYRPPFGAAPVIALHPTDV